VSTSLFFIRKVLNGNFARVSLLESFLLFQIIYFSVEKICILPFVTLIIKLTSTNVAARQQMRSSEHKNALITDTFPNHFCAQVIFYLDEVLMYIIKKHPSKKCSK
jgi:hypothetical protein